MTVLGVDFGTATIEEADHLVRQLVTALGGTIGCTHLVRGVDPHVALSVGFPATAVDHSLELISTLAAGREFGVTDGRHGSGPPGLAEGAASAAAAHEARDGGRAVVYPGVEGLIGRVTVSSILLGSAIDQVVVLTDDSAPTADTVVETRGHVRPEFSGGLLSLTTTPVGPGLLAPFEVADPTPCC